MPIGDPKARLVRGLVLALATVVAIPVGAATFSVSSTDDAIDAAPGDGVCETGAGNGICTLRAGILEANALPGPDTIALPAGTYRIMLTPPEHFVPDPPEIGDFDITGDLTIIGAGAERTAIDGNAGAFGTENEARVIDIAAGAVVAISAVTIRHGHLSVEGAGGIANAGVLTLADCVVSGNSVGLGRFLNPNAGGIGNGGTLTITRCAIRQNYANGQGGGIANGGTLVVEDSVLHNNSGRLGGGAILNFGTLTLRNSTVSGNGSAGDVIPGSFPPFVIQASGAGILDYGGTATLESVTVSGNVLAAGVPGLSGTGAGLGVANNVTTVGFALRNTIVAGNTGDGDCGTPAPASLGNNLDGDGTCLLTGPGDLPATDPLLGPLQDNGGPTMTHALPTGSPAVDTGAAVGCPPADQRGVPRPQGMACDIGAYENNLPCGDGDVDAGEQCDDGDLAAGDCCSHVCAFLAAGAVCEADGEPCTDDRCDGSAQCLLSATIECPPCEVCGPGGSCEVGLRPSCRRPTVGRKSILMMKRGGTAERDRLLWRWVRGEATSSDDLGNPTTTDDYALCVFESAGSVPSLVVGMVAPAGGTCGHGDCWTALGNPPGSGGYRYADPVRTPAGAARLVVKPGADGGARIVANGRGALLGLPAPLDVDLPVTVQLHAEGGACWEADFVDSLQDDDALFRARSSSVP
jgi:cysteine-rich repeat protein